PLAQGSNPQAPGSAGDGVFGAPRRPPAGMPEALALDSGSGIRLLVPAGWQVQVSQPLYDNPTGRGAGMTPNLSPGIPAQKIQYWAVDFVKKPLRHSDLRVTNQSAAEAAYPDRRPRLAISIATKGAKTVIPVTVPELDRPLQVIPQAMVARGMVSDRNYPQFNLSSSWQGVVVETLTDGVRIAALENEITIEASNGAVVKLESLPVGELFDFAKWATKDSSYIRERQRLQQLVTESTGRERILNRFNLAYFFLANNHAADAVGELNLLSKTANEPNLTNDPAVVAMRGVARVLMNNGKKATADLNDKRLDGIPAIGWWRGAALALENDWKSADSQLVKAGPLPQNYPIEIRALLLQLAAESAFEAGSSERSKNLLFGFPAESKNQTFKDQVDYLKARILLATNSPVNEKQAMAIFDRLVSEGRDWGRSHGEWGRIQYLLKMGLLPVDQAIVRLERLQYAWPGSDLQYRTLVQLGDLYFDQLQPRIGLKRLRQAALYFPFAPDRETVKQHLIDRFVGLYTNKDSERIPPLAALAVYDDNRDLTPASERGDLMIQKLADRLVSIDLLDRAADLLSYQIRQRLTGAERARVGARLAAIQLLDKRPDEALVSLDLSESPDAGPEVLDERRRLQAQALFKSGKAEQALRLLDGITDRDADLQRAEILSAGQQWVRLAGVLARLVGRAEPGVQLNESQQQMVVNLAVALVMAGDNGSVRKLHSDFLGSMPDGQLRNAFIMLTAGDGATGGTDVAALNQKFAELEQFNQAMRSFARLESPTKTKK
ncbi:MAG: hypothetical protein ORO03_06420, partial [Alphaproteobacteria bacterium]|nr:hypothetical protein [Alphaproteobacteria bacterium]